MMRSRTTRRETPLDVHMPEPILSPASGVDPEQQALLADSVGLALLVVLELLGPAERLAFVLHDMFAVPFDEIAPIVVLRSDSGRARPRVPALVRGAQAVASQALQFARGGSERAPGGGHRLHRRARENRRHRRALRP
jgi:hypothetical protein